jgi:PST family polysaccharide transporter
MAIYTMKISASAINVFSLAAIQGANALFPLLVFPFLLFTMGKDAFSELVITESLALYLLAICLYSFDTTGVQSIIEARKNGERKTEAACFFNILGARLGLFLASSLLMVGLYYVFGQGELAVFVAWLSFVLGTILQCNYYFQATENNWRLAVFVLVSRLFAVLAIYSNISSEDDLLKASMLLAGSFLVSGVAAYTTLAIHFGETGVRTINVRTMISMIIEGRHLFFGNISVALFRSANVLILAGVANSTAVSSYALAEKVIKSLQALARPLNQLFATKAVIAWSAQPLEKRTSLAAFRLIWNNTRTQIYLMLAVMPASIGLIHLGHAWGFLPGFDNEVLMLISLMSPAVIFGVANAMFGVIGLNLIGAQSYFASAVFSVGGIIFLYSITASFLFASTGAATAYLLAEALLLVVFVMKYHQRAERG